MQIRRVLWLTLLMTAGAAQSARAGIWDVIWEMSGPMLMGFGAHCELDRGGSRCLWQLTDEMKIKEAFEVRKGWLIVEPSVYVSTGVGKWETGSVMMIAVDPMFAWKWSGTAEWRLYTAAGASFNYFFGASVTEFGKIALKIQPLTYDREIHRRWLKQVSFSYTWRRYDGISVTYDRNGVPVLGDGTNVEWVHGPTVALRFN